MKKTLLIHNIEEEKEKFYRAIEYLKKGGTVVFPTETVYGLGANAFNEEGIRKIFEVKGRPPDNPLIVHIYSIEEINLVAEEISPYARILFEKFSPGPLTIVLPKRDNIPSLVTGGLKTVAVRIPSHPIARKILKECNLPIAAPSANISGRPSPTTFEMVISEMEGKVDAIINGGDCEIGLESTVVKFEGDELKILRPGGISEEQIKKILPENFRIIFSSNIKNIESPGTKYTHYKPNAKVILCERDNFGKILLELEGRKVGCLIYKANLCGENVINFNSLEDYAKGLYRAFYEMDREKVEFILAERVEEKGIGRAIMNRLYKASGEIKN